jgi:hypothetical protein
VGNGWHGRSEPRRAGRSRAPAAAHAAPCHDLGRDRMPRTPNLRTTGAANSDGDRGLHGSDAAVLAYGPGCLSEAGGGRGRGGVHGPAACAARRCTNCPSTSALTSETAR